MIVPVTVCKNLLGFSLKLRIEGGIRRNKARHRKCEIRKNNATSGPRHPGRVGCRRRSGEARDRAGGECQGAKTSGDACGLGRGGAEGLTGEPRPGSRLSLRVWSGERCISTRRSPSQLQPKPRGSPLRLSAAAIFALTGGSRGRYFRRTSEQVRPARTPPVVPPGRVPGPRGHLSGSEHRWCRWGAAEDIHRGGRGAGSGMLPIEEGTGERWRRTVAAGLFLLGMAGTPLAQETLPRVGPEVGLTAPVFALPDLAGDLSSLIGRAGWPIGASATRGGISTRPGRWGSASWRPARSSPGPLYVRLCHRHLR